MASAPTSAPVVAPTPDAPKKGWNIPRPSIRLPGIGAVMTTVALATGVVAIKTGLENSNLQESRQYADYGAMRTSMCLGEGAKTAEAKGEKVDIASICNTCKTGVVKSLDTQVPWNFVGNTWNPADKKGAMQKDVSHGAGLVCKGLDLKETK